MVNTSDEQSRHDVIRPKPVMQHIFQALLMLCHVVLHGSPQARADCVKLSVALALAYSQPPVSPPVLTRRRRVPSRQAGKFKPAARTPKANREENWWYRRCALAFLASQPVWSLQSSKKNSPSRYPATDCLTWRPEPPRTLSAEGRRSSTQRVTWHEGVDSSLPHREDF